MSEANLMSVKQLYRPSYEEFCRLAERGNLIPVYREILADLETPVSAFLKIDAGPYSYLLESVEGGEKWGRYCFLGSQPSVIFKCKGNQVEVLRDGVSVSREVEDPYEALHELMAAYKAVELPGLPRFFGGAVGYLGYDMVRNFEKLPEDTVDELGLPDAMFMITDTILIFDHMAHKIKVVSNAHIRNDDTKSAYQEAVEKVEALISKLKSPLPPRSAAPPLNAGENLEFSSNFQKEKFKQIVLAAKEYIRAGDLIQVVLSQRFSIPIPIDPLDIYRALRTVNPSPYMFYLKLGDLQLVGSSPEVLVRLEGKKVELRPIAGTRPRGATPEEDQRLTEELLGDPKERAEHIMLVDLGRNDVGRVSKLGSVKVDELMVVEKYSHVLHIVSNVSGELLEGKSSFDVLRACFPAGTLSGAPKIRAMEVIEELEPCKRGPYGGAVGYFSFSGNMDTCITIRTLAVHDGVGHVQAGGGIVADSDPESEFQESVNKARAIFRAVELARGGLE